MTAAAVVSFRYSCAISEAALTDFFFFLLLLFPETQQQSENFVAEKKKELSLRKYLSMGSLQSFYLEDR